MDKLLGDSESKSKVPEKSSADREWEEIVTIAALSAMQTEADRDTAVAHVEIDKLLAEIANDDSSDQQI